MQDWCLLPVVHDLAQDVVLAGLALGLVDSEGSQTWVDYPAPTDGSEWRSVTAPVHDPETGSRLGGLTLAGPATVVDGAALTLARLAAATVEGELRRTAVSPSAR